MTKTVIEHVPSRLHDRTQRRVGIEGWRLYRSRYRHLRSPTLGAQTWRGSTNTLHVSGNVAWVGHMPSRYRHIEAVFVSEALFAEYAPASNAQGKLS
jgi:hypothetical protein